MTTTTTTCECGVPVAATVDDHHGPTIGICGHTGATWETLLSVLCGGDFAWNVVVYRRDGSTVEGNVYYRHDDVLSVVADDADAVDVNMADIIHIQIT
jgi:hypothetical protein